MKLLFLTCPLQDGLPAPYSFFFCDIVHLLIIHQLYKCCREQHRDPCQGVLVTFLVTFLATLRIHSTPSTRCSAVTVLLQRCRSSVAALSQTCCSAAAAPTLCTHTHSTPAAPDSRIWGEVSQTSLAPESGRATSRPRRGFWLRATPASCGTRRW